MKSATAVVLLSEDNHRDVGEEKYDTLDNNGNIDTTKKSDYFLRKKGTNSTPMHIHDDYKRGTEER